MIISFSAQMLGGFVVEIDYYLRTAEYAKNCVNKSRPMMHCNGKCQMAKKMMQEERKDQQAPERKSVNRNDITLSSKSFFAALVVPYEFETSLKFYSSSNSTSVSRSLDIFHPPQV
jgi:hypothetical protein